MPSKTVLHFRQDPEFAQRARKAFLGTCRSDELLVDDEMFAIFIRQTSGVVKERLEKKGVFEQHECSKFTPEFIAFTQSNNTLNPAG